MSKTSEVWAQSLVRRDIAYTHCNDRLHEQVFAGRRVLLRTSPNPLCSNLDDSSFAAKLSAEFAAQVARSRFANFAASFKIPAESGHPTVVI